MSTFSLLFLIIAIFGQGFVVRASENNDGVLDKIKSGLKYAKNYLETAKEIADLVSQSLKQIKHNKRGDDYDTAGYKKNRIPVKDSEANNLVSGFFRLLGLDSPRIAAIAVNSVVFIAQMISSLLDVKPQPVKETRSRDGESATDFDPLKFILENKNERIQNLVQQAKNPALPEELIDRLDGLDSACVRLLMCKTSPIILAAQNSLMNKTLDKKFDITSWLPSKELFEDNADSCEEQHFDCKIFPEST